MRIKYKDAYDYWTKPQCCQLSDFDAIFSYFSDPFGDFFSKQRQATNLAPFSAAIGDFWRLFEVKASITSSQRAPGACAAPPPSQRTYRQLSPRGKKQTQEPDVLADLKLHPIHPIWIKAVR